MQRKVTGRERNDPLEPKTGVAYPLKDADKFPGNAMKKIVILTVLLCYMLPALFGQKIMHEFMVQQLLANPAGIVLPAGQCS